MLFRVESNRRRNSVTACRQFRYRPFLDCIGGRNFYPYTAEIWTYLKFKIFDMRPQCTSHYALTHPTEWRDLQPRPLFRFANEYLCDMSRSWQSVRSKTSTGLLLTRPLLMRMMVMKNLRQPRNIMPIENLLNTAFRDLQTHILSFRIDSVRNLSLELHQEKIIESNYATGMGTDECWSKEYQWDFIGIRQSFLVYWQ